MEEKERYKVCVGSDYITICDYEENRIKALDNCGMQSLLNLQDNQIHELPKKIIGDVADELGDCGKAYLECEPYIKICIVKSILQAILKKYGDKNESNND